MTKQFKIGEYAIGGIIRVSKAKGHVTIQALDWDTKEVLIDRRFFDWGEEAMSNCLNDLTSSYHADKILDYIKNN
jgi:hypothetical protein